MELILAEIPDPHTDPELYKLVKSHMIHGPCGIFNTDSPCMEDGKCKKHFPKQISEETVISENGAVIYKRRQTENRITINCRRIGERRFSSLWVVPYSPYLLKKYRCHINVEACASLKSVKYLHKYFFENPNSALIKIVERHRDQQDDNVNNVNEGEIADRELEYNEYMKYG